VGAGEGVAVAVDEAVVFGELVADAVGVAFGDSL